LSLKHILLGILAEPASGYQIKQYFNASLRHFWSAELAQVYPTLHKLEQKGMLQSHLAPPTKGPPQRIYSRTEKGADELFNWLEEPISGSERFTYLAQVYFLAQNQSPESAEKFFQSLLKQFQQRLGTLQQILDQWQSEIPGIPEILEDQDLYPYMTLTLGLARNQATVQWCQQSLELIQRRKS